MKILVFILTFTMSSAYAALCDKIEGFDIQYFKDTYPLHSQSKPILSEDQFNAILPNFSYNLCKSAMVERTYIVDQELATLLYTIEDYCDGGNSYGVVLDQNNKIVANIEDSEVFCR